MWSLSHYEVQCCLLPTLAGSLALALQNSDGSLTLTNTLSLPLSLNMSHSKGVIGLTELAIACNPRFYAESCKDAINHITHDCAELVSEMVLSYDPRDHETWDVILPKRSISCEFRLILKG